MERLNWFLWQLEMGEGTELLARAFCHEIDHLNGHVYTEFMEGELQDVGEAAPEEVEE